MALKLLGAERQTSKALEVDTQDEEGDGDDQQDNNHEKEETPKGKKSTTKSDVFFSDFNDENSQLQ